MSLGSYLSAAITPHDSVQDPAKRRRLRALSAVSLFLAFAAASVYLVAVPSGYISTPGVGKAILAASAVLILTWALSRSKFHKYGVVLFFVTLMMLIQLRPLSPAISAERLVFGLAFIAIIQTASALIFTFKTAMRMMIVNILLMIVGFWLRPDMASPIGYLMVTYVMIQSIFIAILAKISQVERNIASKLSAQNAVVGVFSSIAHEINSPLAAAQLILSRAERKGRDGTLDQNALVELIGKSNRALDRAAIISKGLQYYVEQPVANEATAGPVDEIIMSAVKYCEHAFGDQRVNISADLLPIKGLHVLGEFSRLSHAFTNLLSSSWKALAAATGGQINIKARIEGHFIFVEISDSEFHYIGQNTALTTSRPRSDEDSTDKDLEIKLATQLFQGCRAEISKDVSHTRYLIKLKKIDTRA